MIILLFYLHLLIQMYYLISLQNMPSPDNIKRFIDDTVVKSVLKFWISNLKASHMETDEESFKALKKFVRMAIEIHLKHIFNGDEKTRYSVDVLEKVKSDRLKDVTKNIHVPSFSNIDLADSVEIM
jgi:hypothetical protein